MKQFLTTLFFVSSLFAALGQSPQKMTYQAVVRNASDVLVSNASIGMQISILQTSPTGIAVYIETHTPVTNINGLATIEVGSGTVVAGSFSGIDWSAGPYYLKTDTDPTGGTTYSISGTSQLLSVPYALYAESTGSSFSGDYNDLTNAPTNVSTFTNDAGYITNPNDADSDPSNELQSLQLVGSTLTLSGANSVTLPAGGGANTLDLAYDQGGAGLGRTITTDAGSVQINNTGANTTGLEINSGVLNSTAALANVTGVGVGFRAESTNPSNTFSAIQANTNSSTALNSAILGNNSGAGYGVSGQVAVTATGAAGVFGNNLRTNGGFGVLGNGYNGVVGESTQPLGYGVYGSNTGGIAGLSIGTYGVGFNGIYGQTTDIINGWSGYFTQDIGVDGSGYSIGGWFTVSDRRLKSQIVPIESALEKLSLLNGTHYTVTGKSKTPNGELVITSREQYGIIAQDLEKVFPEMISEKAVFNNAGDDTVYKTVEYTQLIPVMLEAIKELNAKVIELQQQIEELESN
jgi:Chaperone of endosialidase